MDVKVFKFTSGVEIVAEYIRKEEAVFVISRPLQAHIMRDQTGNPSLGFAPWTMIGDDRQVKVYQSALACEPLNAEQEIADSYLHNTTGLVLPSGAAGQLLQG